MGEQSQEQGHCKKGSYKNSSLFKSTQIVFILEGSTLKFENQFLKNLKNMYSVYTFKKKVS